MPHPTAFLRWLAMPMGQDELDYSYWSGLCVMWVSGAIGYALGTSGWF